MIKLPGGARRIAVLTTAIAAVATALTWTLTATSSAASPGPATAKAAASVPRCYASDLGVWVPTNQTQGAAGTLLMPIEFTNLSQHTCALYGFPGVSAVSEPSSSGQQLGSPAVWEPSVKATLVTLAPGATGYASLAYSDVITGNCPSAFKRTAAALRVYPPGETVPDYAYWSFPTCTAPGQTSFMRVRVIAPGIGVLGDFG